jgi:hypothetical protein
MIDDQVGDAVVGWRVALLSSASVPGSRAAALRTEATSFPSCRANSAACLIAARVCAFTPLSSQATARPDGRDRYAADRMVKTT